MLVAEGHQVVGTTRDPRKADALRALGAQPVVVDVYDRAALAASVREARPAAVIHQLTDLSSLDFASTARLRVEGTRNLVDAARDAGITRMVTQSFGPAYEPGEGLATEATPRNLHAPEPWTATATSLATMEQMVGELPASVILRYGWLYGPGTSFERDSRTADAVRKGQLPANENVTSFLHVEDAARAAMLALGWPAGIYNIADDDPAPVRVWLPQYAAEIGGPPPATVEGVDPILGRGISNAKARQQVGWVPLHPTWRGGLITGAVHA
jgi:nucleoside-diphosphate-sugar epimerase